jgi:lysophospholipase L1-like esterase
MVTKTQPEGKPKEDHNPGQDEFDKIIERNISHGDERAMEERAKDDNIDSKGFSNKDEAPENEQEENGSNEQEQINQHENQVGRGYKPNNLSRQDKKEARRWMLNKRQAAVGGGITGALLSVFGFFIFQGPLQFVHIAQLMEQFHFSAQEDQADDRFTKLARYLKYRSSGEVEKTRLGAFQNKIADRVETKMNKTGIKSSYTQVFGFGDGYIIDPDKLAASEFEDLKGKTPAEIQNYFKETFNVDIKTKLPNGSAPPKGTFFLDSSGLGYFENGKLNKTMLKAAKYSKVSSSVGARVMGKRAGVNWHPMKKLDNKILKTAEARYLQWKKDRISDVKNGTQVGLETKATPYDPNDDAVKQNADGVEGEAKNTVNEGQQAGDKLSSGNTEAISEFKNRLSVRMTASATNASGTLCMARGIDQNSTEIKQKQVVLPLIRIGVLALSAGNMVMQGGDDVNMEQLGFLAAQLTGVDSSGKKTSWVQAQSIQKKLGNHPDGSMGKPDETLTTITKFSPFHFLNSGSLGNGLATVCSAPVQGAITVVQFFGGPASVLTSAVISEIVGGPIMNTIAHWLAGNAVDPLPVGADFGSSVDYGNALAAAAQGTSRGGRELSKDESIKLATLQQQEWKEEFQHQSIAYKLFNPYDVNSAISTIIDKQSTNPSQNLTNVATSLFHFGNVFSSMSAILTPKTYATDPLYYDYGFSEIGFSIEEMNNLEVKNPYKNADDVVTKILPAHTDFIDRASKCFGVTIDSGTYDITSFQTNMPKYDDTHDASCIDKDVNWLKVRFYIFDTQNIESVACYEGEENACADVGFEDASGSAVTAQADANNNIYLLGDSILEGAYYTTGYLKKDLDDNGWQSTADASAGRSITTPGSDPSNNRPGHEQSGLQAIDTDADTIKKAGVIVIELGTNTSGTASQFEGQIKQVVQKVRDLNGSAKIYWVNIISTSNPIYPSYNNTIQRAADNLGLTVLDEKSKGIALSGDDTHPSNDGYKEYSTVLSNTVGKPAVASSGGLPSGTAKELATQLKQYVNDGKIKCTTGGCPDIINTAAGTSIRGGQGCLVNSLHPELLGMLLKLVQMGHTFILSALCSDHHDDGINGHAGGKAADFNTIDGVFMGPNDTPWSSQKLQVGKKLDQDVASFMPKNTGFGQEKGRCHPHFGFLDGFETFDDACHHQHIEVHQ